MQDEFPYLTRFFGSELIPSPPPFHYDDGLSYDDVLLTPQKGIVDSRKDVDVSTRLTRHIFVNIPIISAPMSSVTECKMAQAMHKAGGAALIHRFIKQNRVLGEWEKTTYGLGEHKSIGLTLGTKSTVKEIGDYYNAGCILFCLDVAHAHSDSVMRVVEEINNTSFRQGIELIVGNVATPEAARDLCLLEVDAIKVGIGPGAACTTRTVTGFGVPQLTAIIDCAKVARDFDIPVIADGGIKNSGDIVKALAAGASTVMLGKLLAGADEAPHPGEYFGMASKRVNGHHAPEGIEGTVEASGPVSEILKSLVWGVKSGISYGGGSNIEELQQKAIFRKVSPLTQFIETATRL